MPDLFEGFRWKEVVSVVTGFTASVGFFVLIMIDAYRDLDQTLTTRVDNTAKFVLEDSRLLRGQMRELEASLSNLERDAAVERILRICRERPEVCDDK